MSLVVSVNLLVALAEPLSEPGLLAQPWFQPVMMLLCLAAATAWLTARWMIRRRSGCAGDCSRCTAHGAETRPGACGRPPGGGIRPDGLRVLQGRGAGSEAPRSSANVPPRTAV
jgi:hypothetical protein